MPSTHTRIWDFGDTVADRYTVAFEDEHETYFMGIGATGNVPNGFCMHVDGVMVGDHLGAEITLDEMTEAARRAVLAEERTDYATYGEER